MFFVNVSGPIDVESERFCNRRTGSHMLVIGDENNYTSFGGMVVGDRNETASTYASVSGGYTNTASGVKASVTGGQSKTATADYCIVGDNGVDC